MSLNSSQLAYCIVTLFLLKHSTKKQDRMAKRNSKNILLTMVNQDERRNVYNLNSGNMIDCAIEKNIKNICSDDIAIDYLKKFRVFGGKLFECTTLVIHGTQYHEGQYILLPESSNEYPKFGKIVKLLCDSKHGYFMYQKTSSVYSTEADLFMIEVKEKQKIIMAKHICSYLPLESYELGEKKELSISLRHNILQHI